MRRGTKTGLATAALLLAAAAGLLDGELGLRGPAFAGGRGVGGATVSVATSDAAASQSYEPTAWDSDAYPEYYRLAGPAVVGDAPAPGEVRYEGLDALGRTHSVVATVTYGMYEATRDHEPHLDKDDNPAGWGHNGKVDIEVPGGKTYHGYLWNRSHLLADSLGGEAARENLVTGTRTQNVGANDGQGGMAYEEERVRSWLAAHPDGTVYYAATPAYAGDELIPRSVFVDILTSDGAINDHVEVYNTALGYTLNYTTGTFTAQ